MKIIQQSSAAMIVALIVSVNASATESAPRLFIEDMVSQITEALDARQDQNRFSEQDRNAIRKALIGRIDYQTMSMRILGGKAWRKLNASEKLEFTVLFRETLFTEIFRESLVQIYASRLPANNGGSIVFKDVEFNTTGLRATVKLLVNGNGYKTAVEYSLQKTSRGWLIVDFIVEKFKIVKYFRNHYRHILKEKSFGELTESMRDLIAVQKSRSAG